MQVKIGSYNHHPCDNFLKPVSKKSLTVRKLGNAGVNILCAKLIVCLRYCSVFNYTITHHFHPGRLSERFKLRIFRIRL